MYSKNIRYFELRKIVIFAQITESSVKFIHEIESLKLLCIDIIIYLVYNIVKMQPNGLQNLIWRYLMKTIEDLFFGRNIPYDSPSLDPAEYRRLADKIAEAELPLYRSMTVEQKDLCNRYVDRCADLADAESRDAFVRGFRLGVRLLLESLVDNPCICAKRNP